MKNISAILFFCFFIGGQSLSAQHRSINFEKGKWADVLAKAKKENKIIYLDCYTTWCGPCKWMAKNVFTNDTAADFYNAEFVNVEIDMEKGEGPELAKKFGIMAYPTMIYFNGDGEQLHRTCGSTPMETFIDNAKDALDPSRQMASLTKAFNSDPGNGTKAIAYFRMLSNACQSANAAIDNYFAQQKESDFTSRSNWNVFYNFENRYDSKAFQYFQSNIETFRKLYTADSVEEKLDQIYSARLNITSQEKDKTENDQVKKSMRDLHMANAEKIIQHSDMIMYHREKDWANYAAAAAAYIPKYSSKNIYDLNDAAWNFYLNVDDKSMLEKAAEWAKMATVISDDYPSNDTYASLLYKLGKKSEAKTAAEKAISLAKKTGEDANTTESLLHKINAMK